MYQTVHWLPEASDSQTAWHADELLTYNDVLLHRHLNEKAVCHNLD